MDTVDTLAIFDVALTRYYESLSSDGRGMPHFTEAVIGLMHCTACGDTRRMRAELLYPRVVVPSFGYEQKPYNLADEPIILCRLRCVQCDAAYTVLKHHGPTGLALAVLPSASGGLSTPHTPESVAYYLDQAYKARSLGGNSAAIAMFRAALEHLLYEQGYQTGMLDRKIKDLEAAIAGGGAPPWARDLDTEYLRVIKELGNGAIHTNGGDVKKQALLDSALVVAVEATFAGLLHLVYEIPHQKTVRLADLKAKAALLK